MMTLARDAGHPVSWHEPRQGGMAVARTVRALADELSGVHRLVVGDPYSGVIHVIISVTRLAEVTIVDDGTATLEFARQWAAGEQLSRWHQVAAPSQRRQIATGPGPDCRVSTSPAPLSRVAGSGCSPACQWTYRGFGPSATTSRGCAPGTRPRLKPSADLVGTSLVESGVVKADAYLDGVETLIARYEADRYFAHRKEAGWKLDLIERMGIDVVRPTLPLEIVARRGPSAARSSASLRQWFTHFPRCWPNQSRGRGL